MTVLCSNVIWEINSIISPLEQTYQREAAVAYFICSMISTFFFATSFRSDYQIKFCYPGYVLMAFRNTIRLFDFEKTKQIFGEEKFSKVSYFQVVGTTGLIIFCLLNFQNVRYNSHISASLMVFFLFALFSSNHDGLGLKHW